MLCHQSIVLASFLHVSDLSVELLHVLVLPLLGLHSPFLLL
jgi:hypothetical protein